MKHTKEQYAESAAKYGITQGPYTPVSGQGAHYRDWYIRVGTKREDGSWPAVAKCCSSQIGARVVSERNAVALAQLPDLLIERDANAAEILRLRAALDLIQIYGLRVGGMSPDDSLRECVATARAALQGGAA